jgi:hypothetical protein
MDLRQQVALLIALCSLSSIGATHRTQNFVVHAASDQIAQQVGQYAEKFRREKALEWLGQEMPPWGQPCPIRVSLTNGGPGGATTFAFEGGGIAEQHMNVQGPLDRILISVLPHEVTHTVFAYRFRCPLPRWADEGGSVLSEDDEERARHDRMVRQSLASGRAFRLRVLFEMRDYPRDTADVLTLYAQGYSISRFLVERSNRVAFLNFVGDGMRQGWDAAIQSHFRLRNVEELEEYWLNWMRGTYRTEDSQVASRSRQQAPVTASPVSQPQAYQTPRAELRPPVVVTPAVIRAAAPEEEFGRPAPQIRSVPRSFTQQLPDGWTPVPGQPRPQPYPNQQYAQPGPGGSQIYPPVVHPF